MSLSHHFHHLNGLVTRQLWTNVIVEHPLTKTRYIDFVFANYAVISAEALEVFVVALKALHKKTNPLSPGQRPRYKCLGACLCGRDIETLQSFMCLGNIVQNNIGSCREVLRWTAMADNVMDSA